MLQNQRSYTSLALLSLIIILLSGCASAAPVPIETSQLSESPETTAVQAPIAMTVYKSPTCGCCGKWVEHMRDAGFDVIVDDFADMSIIKEQYDVPQQLQSCHTALVGDYVIEGHVPVDAIERLLAERPDVKGLAVPGMPVGSPGMEVEGYENEPFDVLRFDASGQTEVFASYPR